MRTVVVFVSLIALLCLMPALCSGDPQQDQPKADRGDESQRTAKTHLAEPTAAVFKGNVVVLTRTKDDACTLKNMTTAELCGRKFLVGTDVESGYTRGMFVGKRVWIPIEEVTKLVEDGENKPATK